MSGKWLALWVLVVGGCAVDRSALSEAARVGQAASMAAACAGCHGASAGPAIPDLSQLSVQQIVELFDSYRADPDGPTAMHRLARGYSEEERRMIAEYLGG